MEALYLVQGPMLDEFPASLIRSVPLIERIGRIGCRGGKNSRCGAIPGPKAVAQLVGESILR